LSILRESKLFMAMIKLPGLIDPHVHLREPGATHKEDFDTGTAAALAGGFTTVLAMPNTNPPLVDQVSFDQARHAAGEKARCDYGIYLGASADNYRTYTSLAKQACGLKLYLDLTYGPLQVKGLEVQRRHLEAWPSDRPLVAHAERRSLAAILLLAMLQERPIHICHVSRRIEIQLIREMKQRGYPVTCEVTPHHLFLSEEDIPHIGPGRSEVRPVLAAKADQAALWDNLSVIDCFATDHAPHTLQEKDSADPPPGFPGLETSLALFANAVHEGRLSMNDLIARLHLNPQRIFGLPANTDAEVEFDPDAVWDVCAKDFHSRCGWSPFEGMQLQGRVRRVKLHGQLAYQDGEILAPKGFGRDVASIK
jgi:carbamoyl-phosphate synthase/aspartate carbamoyltransferase/dihydroorotase